MREYKVLVVDVDCTLAAEKNADRDYSELQPISAVRNRLVALKNEGWKIILYTSRNMRSHDGNLGKINLHTAPILIQWLRTHAIPCDELYFGKPWCGHDGFYIDDRAIRPREFATLTLAEIEALIKRDRLLE